MDKEIKISIKINSETGEVVALRREFEGLNQATQKTANSTQKFIDKLTNVAKIAVASIAIYELTKQVKDLAASFIETASKFEKFNLVLETLEGNAKKAQQDLEWIKKFAKTTPYEIDQVTEAFVRLKAYGFKATKDLKTLGDTAAAFARPLEDTVEALADATTGEFERLKAFGIRAYATANKVAFQWADRSGQIRHIVINNNSKIIESTLLAIWNNRYAGAMDKLSNSWDGILSNMSDSWTNFKAEVSKIGFKEAEKDLKTLQIVWNNVLNDMKEPVAEFEAEVVKGFKQIVLSIAIVDDSIEDLIGVITHSFKGLVYGTHYLFDGIPAAIEDAINGVLRLLNKLPDFIKDKIGVHDFTINMGWSDARDKWAKASANEFKQAWEYMGRIARGEIGDTYKYWKKKFDEAEKEEKKSEKIKKILKEIGKKGPLDRSELLQNNDIDNQGNYLDYTERKLNEQIQSYQIINSLTKEQQSLLKQLKQQYINLLPPKEQIEAWYKNIVDTINKTITDPKLKKQAFELALKIKVKKEQQLEVKQEKDSTITFNSFEDVISTSIKKVFEHLGQQIPNWANTLIKHIDSISFIIQKGVSYLFDKAYDKIKAKYTGLINSLQQNIYTKQLQSKAYNAFGLQGQGILTEYQANVTNIQMLQAQNAMNYELMKKAKHYKEITQYTLETLSIAAGTAAAVWFDGGAVLEGIKMAIKAQDWAEQATGFKNFQQSFIEGVDKLKQAVRDLADNLIQIAGNVYKSIKDYRNIFDKITGSKTYKIQQFKESLSFISKYSDLTTSALANLTQNVLKASKGFVEGAVKNASDFKKLLGGEVFKKYGLAIDALNDKFKNSLNVIANLIDIQRQAKNAIKDYIAELKGSLGDTQYQQRYTQQAFAQALKDYYAGKIDGSTLLEKAKAYQNAGGDVSKIIKTLQGIEAQSTKDYLKGILEATTKFNAVGLPESNIKALQSPQIQTLNVIKDTKNILQHIMDILGGGFNKFGDLLSGILSGVNTIVKLLRSVLGAIIGGVLHIVSGITGAITNVGKTLVNALSNLGKFIGNLLGKIGNFALNVSGSILNTAGNLVGGVVKDISKSVSSVGKSVSHAVSHVFHSLGFAEGGYTGSGLGYVDSTGEVVAGVVHAGEWVAPAWMVNSMPNVFNALEGLRLTHSVNNSLFNPVVNVAVDLGLIRETNVILVQQLSIQKKMLRLLQKFDEEGIKCVS